MPLQANLLCKTYHEIRREQYANKCIVLKPSLIPRIIDNWKPIFFKDNKKNTYVSTEIFLIQRRGYGFCHFKRQ